MARTAEGAALTAQHTRQQLAMRAALIRDLGQVWPLWEIGDVTAFNTFLDIAVTLIQARAADSAGIAARYFRLFRQAEGVAGASEPRLAERPSVADIASSLRATGLAGTMRALRAGLSPQAASRSGFVQASGSAARLALGGGRDTIVKSSGADERAQGWLRVASGGACAFCAMLASRGADYSRERTASFEAHDHCGCTAEPFYAGSKLPATSRRFAEQWHAAQSAARESGTSSQGTGNDALNTFRRYLTEGA